MDEDTMLKLTLVGLMILMISIGILGLSLQKARTEITKGNQCNEIIDRIYEQCQEESEIKLTTMKGRDTTIKYENGVCIIK